MAKRLWLMALLVATQGACDPALAPDAGSPSDAATSDTLELDASALDVSLEDGTVPDASPLDSGPRTDGGASPDTGMLADSATDSGTVSGVILTGGVHSARIDLSALGSEIAGSTTEIEYALVFGTNPPDRPSISGTVDRAALATAIDLDHIPLPGVYRVYVRELSTSGAGPWGPPSAPVNVRQPSAVSGRPWMSEVLSMTGHGVVGSIVGRTSTAPLVTVDASTMSVSAINAVLPSGVNASTNPRGEVIVRVTGDDVTLADFFFRDVQISVSTSADRAVIEQCVFSPPNFGAAILVVRGGSPGHVARINHNTVLGARRFGGTGQFITAQIGRSTSELSGRIDEIAHNFVSGLSNDPMTVGGSSVSGGLQIHHNVLDAIGWVTGNASWENNHPHGDMVTINASFGNGTDVYSNVMWPHEQAVVDIPALGLGLAGEGELAGEYRPYAGNFQFVLGDEGFAANNNWIRANPIGSTSPTMTGAIRVYQNLVPKGDLMPGPPMQFNRGYTDSAVYDNVFAPNTRANGPGYGGATDTDLASAYFRGTATPVYSGADNLNYWTGAAWSSVSTPSALPSPL